MRIRSIKPEFWRSKDVSSLPPEDRLLFIGLWSYVDDNGVGRAELSDIVADLFADDMFKDPRETVARVSRGLARLSEGDLIRLYEVENRPYLSICSWSKHQRIDKPAKARYPQYDADSRDCRETVARVPEILAPGTGEQGNRGTGEQGNRSARRSAPIDPDGFGEFWQEYPRKEAKGKARDAYVKALGKVDADTLRAAATRYAQSRAGEEPKFTKHPATWLNQECWLDTPVPPSARDGRRTSDRQGDILRAEMDAARRWDEAHEHETKEITS